MARGPCLVVGLIEDVKNIDVASFGAELEVWGKLHSDILTTAFVKIGPRGNVADYFIAIAVFQVGD